MPQPTSWTDDRNSRWIVQVPVVSIARTETRDATHGMRKLATIVGKLLWLAEVSLHIATDGAGGIDVRWVVRAADEDEAQSCAADLRSLLDAVVPWMGLGRSATPVTTGPLPDDDRFATHHFLPGPAESTSVVHRESPPWRFARADGQPWRLEITLGGLAVADDPADAPAPLARARVTLFGAGPRADLLAGLIAEDTLGGHSLRAEPIRLDHALAFADFSTDLLGHLLAAPARMPRAFPASTPKGLPDLVATMAAAPSPHLLLLGGTGQGKSTLLVRLAEQWSADSHQLICADVHDGEFAARVHDRAMRHGTDPMVLDLGPHPDGRHAGLSLTTPPAGVEAQRWADDLFGIIRDVLWENMPDDFFGPVGRRAVTLCIKALVRDPQGPQPLTQLPDLLDTGDAGFRDELLTRIGDPALTRAMRTEVMPMLTSKDPGNSAIWLISKLEPLIGAGPVARIIGSDDSVAMVDRAVLSGRSVVPLAPAAHLGDGASRVLVSVLLHRMWLLLRSRPTGRPTELLLDEWQRFPIPTIGSMLAEGRKFGVSLRLANQNLNQLPGRLVQTVLANCGTVATFRCAPADARELDLLFPRITQFQLLTLPPHHLAVTAGDHDMLVRTPEPLDGPREIPAEFRRPPSSPRLRPARPATESAGVDTMVHPQSGPLEEWVASRRGSR